MSEDRIRSESTQLAFAVVEALSKRPIAGHTVDGLVSELGRSRDMVYRATRNVAIAGWAEQTSGTWRLTPRATLLSANFNADIARYIHAHTGDSK